MADIAVLNTTNNLSGKTLLTAEVDTTVTANITFDRDPSAPFTVPSGSAVVTNLDADKVDGLDSTALGRLASAGTWTANQTLNDSVKHIYGTGGDAELYYDGTDLILNTQAVGTGALSLTKGQIKFPTVQNASADANTLDDYEEGTWTPVIGGSTSESGQAYSAQTGTYVKIGKFVFITCHVALSTLGTITGSGKLKGLPFTPDAQFAVQLQWANTTTAYVSMSAEWTAGTSLDIRGATAAATTALGSTAQADFANTTTFRFTGHFRTAS